MFFHCLNGGFCRAGNDLCRKYSKRQRLENSVTCFNLQKSLWPDLSQSNPLATPIWVHHLTHWHIIDALSGDGGSYTTMSRLLISKRNHKVRAHAQLALWPWFIIIIMLAGFSFFFFMTALIGCYLCTKNRDTNTHTHTLPSLWEVPVPKHRHCWWSTTWQLCYKIPQPPVQNQASLIH